MEVPVIGGLLGIGVDIQCYTSPEINFSEGVEPGQEQFPEGGLMKVRYTINAGNLANNENIVFYVISIDLPGVPESQRVMEDLDEISRIEEYSTTYKTRLQPTFS